MTTKHKLVGERVNNPSKQQIRRIVGKAETIDGFTMRPGYLYTVVRAISARVNQNYDGWPSDELKKSYKTFIGKPVFVNHENYDPEKARGVVVAARYVEAGNDKYVEVIQEIDAKRFPKLAHEIKTGGLDSVSMGAEAGFTICSYCGNKAQDVPDMCDHVLFHKGEKLSRFNRKTGRREDVLVYESCYKLSFFELSYVFDPADETAVASKVLVAGRQKESIVPDEYKGMSDNWMHDDGRPEPEHPIMADWDLFADNRGISGNPTMSHGHEFMNTKPWAKEDPDVSNAFWGHFSDRYGRRNFEDKVLRTAGFHVHSADCPPGKDCSIGGKPEDQITPDSANNPLNGGGSSGGGGSAPAAGSGAGTAIGGGELGKTPAAGGGTPQPGDAKYLPSTKPLYDDLTKSLPGVDIGTYRVDDYHEHDHGAMDVMTSDPTQADLVKQKAFDSGAPYVLWQQKQWNSDGTSSDMPDRGSPTQNHMDHVHTAPIGGKAARFEDRVLRTAGLKKADKCHYCAGDAEDGRKSCSAHSKMEDQKFKAAVLQAMGVTDGGSMTYQDRVLAAAGLKSAGGAHRQQTGPKHQAPFGYTPKDMPGQYQVMDGAEFAKQYDERQQQGDPEDMVGGPKHRAASYEARVLRAWGETEAPAAVDTMREEGSAPEDDNNDFYHYVEPPKELQTPDLSQAAQIDREQDEDGQAGMDGAPGPSSPDAGMMGGQQPQQQYMELKIPIPQQGQAGAPNTPAMPMQPYQDQPPAPMPPGPPMGGPPAPPGPPQQQIAASTRAYFDQYFSKTPRLQTLGNRAAVSTTSRNPMKGTANMAGNTLASRGKTVTAGRRQHFAEGPLVDTGDQSRNDQGEQEEIFLSQTPPAESVELPKDGQEISNTENNLVARVQKGRVQLLADAQKLAALRARRTAGDAGGPVATEVNPSSSTGPAGEELTGNDFESANPNEGVTETQPKDASLHAFKAFDRWLAASTGRPSRQHTSATIRRAADDFSRQANISLQAMYPALGIVLEAVRKNEKAAANKGAKMRKRADEKLEVAAPDGRIDVEAPVNDTTDAEAQASQFDLHDFGNNAGDNIADPDLSTDQNWAPGEANKTSRVKTAGGILAFRCAEAMIAAGLEPNTVERKYALAGEYENMNRGLIQDRVALLERCAGVLANERRKAVSGSTRGAALQAPVPRNLSQGAQRTAGRGLSPNDPRNDSTMFV